MCSSIADFNVVYEGENNLAGITIRQPGNEGLLL